MWFVRTADLGTVNEGTRDEKRGGLHVNVCKDGCTVLRYSGPGGLQHPFRVLQMQLLGMIASPHACRAGGIAGASVAGLLHQSRHASNAIKCCTGERAWSGRHCTARPRCSTAQRRIQDTSHAGSGKAGWLCISRCHATESGLIPFWQRRRSGALDSLCFSACRMGCRPCSDSRCLSACQPPCTVAHSASRRA